MAYKDPDKQRQVQRDWVRQKRLSQQGSTQPQTIADVKALSADQAKTILKDWADGSGTEYQRRMGVLAEHYGQKAILAEKGYGGRG